MQTPESTETAETELWCKCIICVEYFTSADVKEHKDSYEHNRRIAAYNGDELPEYIFDVKELPINCAPYYAGEMPTKAKLCIEFHCATNNLHEFELDIDYFTKKLDELGGDINDMKELLNRIEKINTSGELKKPIVYDTANMYDQIRKMNEQIEPMNLWKDENMAWNLKNNLHSANEINEQDYIDSCLLEFVIKESENKYKPLDDETEKLISKIEILDVEQDKIKNNYLESLLGEPINKNTFTEDDLLESSEDNIDFDDFIDFNTENYDPDN